MHAFGFWPPPLPERVEHLQEEIIHEAQTMRQYNHPNVLPLYASFVEGQDLWMVMPYIAGGSVLHIMKYAWPEVGLALACALLLPCRARGGCRFGLYLATALLACWCLAWSGVGALGSLCVPCCW